MDYHRIAAFTICAANYLPQANVLADSLATFHPNVRLITFLLDEIPGGAIVSPYLDIKAARDVLSPAVWHHKVCFYEILELATSVKAACFQFLLENYDAVFYFDPDICFFSALPDLDAWPSQEINAILTPHLLAPLPDDGFRPTNLDILRAGFYNLGFAGFRRGIETNNFLKWWATVLHEHCLSDVSTGVFTDQKWVNFATSFIDGVHLVRDPGWNAAYWNLHERKPILSERGWLIESSDGSSSPLRFFHYSGFSPDRAALSKHEDRFGMKPPGDTLLLLESYGAALKAAGHDGLPRAAIAEPSFASGLRWDQVLRKLYRSAIKDGLEVGDPVSEELFLEWVGGTEINDHLCRYLRALLQLRGDVSITYDGGRNLKGLQRWLWTSGITEMGIDPGLLSRLCISSGDEEISVQYVGYLRAHLGIGEAARNSVDALRGAGIGVEIFDVSDTANIQLGKYENLARSTGACRPQMTIFGVNADVFPAILMCIPDEMVDAYRIGCWYWETSEFPDEWCNRFDLVDEVWAATNYVAEAIRAKATVPVVVMPPMVNPPKVIADRPWLRSLINEVKDSEFLFFFQFDAASIPYRKNPEATINAFKSAFSPTEPVRLIIKILNGDRIPVWLEQLKALAGGYNVSFFEAPLDSLERFRFLASVDCFVSLHRAEGFGLSIAEAMAYGIPVVVTGWSGNTDFTSDQNAALVEFDLISTKETYGPYKAGTIWAEPRVDDAARKMRQIYQDPQWRLALSQAGRETIKNNLSENAVGNKMKKRLERVMGSARFASSFARHAEEGRSVKKSHKAWRPRHGAGRLAILVKDVCYFPRYYLSKVPRAISMLSRFGFVELFRRAVFVAAVVPGSHKAKRSTLILRKQK